MSEPVYKACTTGRDKRFPITPLSKDRLGMFVRPVRPGPRERFRARNGPAIEEWEHALIGREVIGKDAADTVSGPSLHATLEICAKKAQGALSRIPVEIWLRVEKDPT